MSDEINQVSPQQVSPKRINWRPIGLTLLAAIVLGAGSCFGAIISGGKTLSVIFSVIFIACVLAFVLGLLWGLITRLKSL
jgi:hypothetical protein